MSVDGREEQTPPKPRQLWPVLLLSPTPGLPSQPHGTTPNPVLRTEAGQTGLLPVSSVF